MSETLPYNPPLPIDPALLPTPVIEAELIASVVAQSISIHQQLRLLLAYDQRGAWVASGATSCAAWWAATADIEVSTARDQMRVARAIDEIDLLDRALATQQLSYAKVRYLARHIDAENVDDLIVIAERVPAGRLGQAIAAYHASKMTADELNAQQAAGRSVSWRTDADGMYVLTARLLPIDGASLIVEVDSLMMRGAGTAGELIGQQRHDAFLSLLASRAARGTGQASGAELPANPLAEVVVHVVVNADGGLVHTLEDGTPLPETQASELMCGATLRALLHDASGSPIDASPAAPRASKRQLSLVRARDKHCQYKRCRATAFLHAHHIQHREHGGPTTIANLTLVCSLHHRHIHASDPEWMPIWKQGL